LWRLLVWIESWLLAVAAFHGYRPIHAAFWIPLVIAAGPGAIIVAMWALAKGATGERAAPAVRAQSWEVAIAAASVIAAGAWTVRWTVQARDDLHAIDEMIGQATIIVDVSVTWLSALACFAALALDWLLSAAKGRYGHMMTRLRRLHVVVTIVHVAALFGAAWLFTQWPEAATPGGAPPAAVLLERARTALHVYEYARATMFPVQSFFAALAVLVATLNNPAPSLAASGG